MKSNNESAFHITDIQWDTDDEEVEGLPEFYCLPFSKLLYENESLDDVLVADEIVGTRLYLTRHIGK